MGFFFDLFDCDIETFLADHWHQNPFFGQYNHGDPNRLPAHENITALLTRMPLPLQLVRVFHGAEIVNTASYARTVRIASATLSSLVSGEKIIDYFQSGYTIALSAVDEYFSSISELRSALENDLRHPVDAYIFLVPPESTGLGPHIDYEDTFIIQLGGVRDWKVYPCYTQNPVRDVPLGPCLNDPLMTTVLNAGDMLYIPRGFPHHSNPTREASVHLNLSITYHTWTEAVHALAMKAINDGLARGDVINPTILQSESLFQIKLNEQINKFKQSLDQVVQRTDLSLFYKQLQ